MSDHSLFILALTAWKNGARTPHKAQESRLSGTIARDGGRAGRSHRSHSRQGRIRRVDDLELASFVCVTSIEALTHNAVLHHSKMLSDETMEALIEERARLVTGYLMSG